MLNPLPVLLLAVLGAVPAWADILLIPAGANWKYLDDGTRPAGWAGSAFDDSGWKSGPAKLGYNSNAATVISYGGNSSAKHITACFRHTFDVADPAAHTGLKLRLLRDDGAVVYLNGVEIYRSNMPAGEVSAGTRAATVVGGSSETTFFETLTSAGGLAAGPNVLAVEVHQSSGTSSDVSFNLEVTGLNDGVVIPPPTVTPTSTVIRGPYLQNAATSPPGGEQPAASSITVRWRTDAATGSTVRFRAAAETLAQSVENSAPATEHEVRLTGLQPDTQYFYEIGSPSGPQGGGPGDSFFTPPVPGSRQPFRVWVLGDSGTANANARAVSDAYKAFNGTDYTDMWLMLGDNAYNNGTDAEFQKAVFNMYPEMLRQSPLWSTLGNHEHNTSRGAPYFNIHTFPTRGEAGGQPSGTEKYYSFDYGNVHFICLDSMSSDRSASGPMATWLHADLESTTQDWIIAFWHHPPYTKGSHNSDSEAQLVQMRENLLPLLEAGGVDLVLSGHSHSYERSWFLNGHYGPSGTFSESMKKAQGSGLEDTDGAGAYTKPAELPPNQGTVYAVAGSSGKATHWWGGSTAPVNPNPHPAMVVSLLKLGSLVMDVNGSRLDVRFLNSAGTVDDRFTLKKGARRRLEGGGL